jgi:hypothetical protein
MRELIGNIWDLAQDLTSNYGYDSLAVAITTNGFTKRDGSAVMGRGIAKQAVSSWPWLQNQLGVYLRKYGNRAFYLDRKLRIVTMPVKPTSRPFGQCDIVQHMMGKFKFGDRVPGWACTAEMGIIERSAKQLVEMADKFGWDGVLIPRPGCGNGELDWDDVKPALESILDDRFIACTFKK